VSRLPASLQVELHDDVAVLRLARERKRNALDDATVLGIGTFFSDLPHGVRTVVLDAQGPHFCAGLDLSELTERSTFEGLEHSRMCTGPSRGWRPGLFRSFPCCGAP